MSIPSRVIGLLLGLAIPASAQLTRVANTTLTMPADLPSATGYTVTENALGSLTFSAPICVANVAGETNRLFVVERNNGLIQRVNLAGAAPAKNQWFSLASILGTGESRRTDFENGFFSMAFHPQFASNGVFCVFYSLQVSEAGSAKLFQRIHWVKVSNPTGATATLHSHRPLITQLDEAGNHNGGDLHFGPDGYLYASVGDEGGGGDTYNNARFINKDFFGGILRIDVDNLPANLVPNAHAQASTTFPSAVHAGTYRVPADNPFIGHATWHNLVIAPASVRTELWATGLRNPWRMSFDTPTGRLFVGDVGQNAWEEVDIVTAGGDYGWSWREGLAAYSSPPAPTTPPVAGFMPVSPIYDYAHGSGNLQGNSITGGVVYRGTRFSELFEAYIFCDYQSGRIWSLRPSTPEWTPTLLATEASIAEIGVDPRNGDVLFADLVDGLIRRLNRSGTSGTPPPALLSATGAFADLATLTPNAGIVPYEPNLTFWSDHAIKSRWFSVPNPAQDITYHPEANWSFPVGTVWIKHFDIETTRGDPLTRKRLETRFLVRTANGNYGVTYKWRVDNSDADLVAEDGLNEVLTINEGGVPVAQTWRYPSRNECRTCHTAVAGHALSFNTRQLNRERDFGGGLQNQLLALESAGYFTGPPVGDPGVLHAFATPADASQSLEWRVRSYLAVNCVHCHQPGGAALGAWDARSTTSTDQAGLIRGAVVNSLGDPARRVIVPGDEALSLLLVRLQGGGGVPRMPPLGTSLIDTNGVQLIRDWIASLPARRSFTEWQSDWFAPGAPLSGAGDDADFDGQTNILEYLGGSVPTDNGTVWTWSAHATNNLFEVSFTHPAGRSILIEASPDLVQWSRWSAPGNQLQYPGATQDRVISAPVEGDLEYFRAVLSQP